MNHHFQQTRWGLTDLLETPGGAPLQQALADIESRTKNLEAARERLAADMAESEFLGLMREYEELYAALNKIGAYGFLWFSEDTQNQTALSFKARMEQLAADVTNRVLFFSLWWKELDHANAERLMKNAGDWGYFLENERRMTPHTLKEGEEQVVNIKDVNGIGGLVTIYDMITSRYEFTLQVDGETHKLNREQLSTYVRHPSAEVRAAAYRELYRPFSQDGPVLARIYSNRVNDWKAEQVGLRHFTTPISARNLGNDVPDEAVETLLQVSRRNAPLFQRYFKLKGKWLGLVLMHRSDLYAPLAQAAEKEIPYPEAVELVLDSLNRFSAQVAQAARNVFEHNHIDSEVRATKLGGAYCASILPSMVPFVQTSYTGKARDVSVLAHELGHAVHAQMAREHSPLTFHSSLPMAETASVFSEMILNEQLLNAEKEATVRRDILARMVDDAYATMLRQAYLVLFEQVAYPAIGEGQTMDELNALYLENLHEQFGDALEVQDDFKWEWITIPHIYHTPFYTYAYSFGQLLTLSLYQRYKQEGASFVPKYLKILAYGGSASPSQILGEAGIDIRSDQFWQGGYDVVKGLIDQLEALEQVSA
ncbi:MAG: M3 family oligoendopeptidase [Anaerolineae bacterium]